MTWIRWTATIPGSTTFTFQRRAAGVRVGGRCKPVRRGRSARRAKRCARWAGVRGTLTAAAQPGKNRRVFGGWVGRRRMKPGTYRMTATPISYDARSGTPRRMISLNDRTRKMIAIARNPTPNVQAAIAICCPTE